ncbi:MAG: type II toxin-antitoxin system PemK/MazF family toxin [Patescibacteria group bacterium]|jgi:mRNA interferase MazF
MLIKQGDIFIVDLNPVRGHEQAGLRPVLILQNNILNKYLSTVIIAPITSNLVAKDKLAAFYLAKDISRLSKDSVILLYQIKTIDKRRLMNKISYLSEEIVKDIKARLKYIF